MAKTFLALIVWLSIVFPAVAAQSPPPKKAPRPAWSELTPAQQKILAPLQADWDGFDTTRRKKWAAIADRYPSMTPQAQQRLQKRMTDWAKLTPAQRQAARERYLQIRKLPPDQRKAVRSQWQQYQDSLAPPAEAPPETAAAPEPAAPGQEPLATPGQEPSPAPGQEPPPATAGSTPPTTQ